MRSLLFALCLLLLRFDPAAATTLIGHELRVRLDPASALIEAEDRLRLPPERTDWTLVLHTGLAPRVTSGQATLVPISTQGHLTAYRLSLRAPGEVGLAYRGVIRHALKETQEGLGRTAQSSVGTIAPDGVFLDGASGWYPRVPETLQILDLSVELPKGWAAVSQGTGTADPETGRAHWREAQPQEDLYLVAGRFAIYRRTAPGVSAEVYLRTPDPGLAERYLAATLRYLAFYSELIGPYPYAKFALVENLWESGYGMPSLTLLGPKVIRLPFILETSYPHEILHNWWGNGVYVDYGSGNWSEGLTHYLADYWLAERAGRVRELRCGILKDYADYIRQAQDLPLEQFTQRHSPATQAIGYGKGSILWHMLRRRLGDEPFLAGLRRFYAAHRFQIASYRDLERSFVETTGQDLGAFFEAWIKRPGAPQLALAEVRLESLDGTYRLSARIDQTQADPPFPLRIPIAIEFASGERLMQWVEGDTRTIEFELTLTQAPTHLALDPDCELFRTLAPGEWPATLSAILGAEDGLILIPAAAPEPLKSQYRALAEFWGATHPGWQVGEDDSLERLPPEPAVWLLGWENRYLSVFAEGDEGLALDAGARRLRLPEGTVDPEGDSLVLTRMHRGQPIAWLATRLPEALPALARKVPHYGRYSYLVFAGPQATNRIKGLWPPGESPLGHCLQPEGCAPQRPNAND
ncbi:M1 family peptidase [Caldichromatium japonicum]|uniref:M1 family peptidase n=1 Tax=Caldichromatium japonicum TaxID=2699430 RepID=A0A6G7VGK4_9GAMM|nr:M1 family peptidase [Caldichromatium japonicum]